MSLENFFVLLILYTSAQWGASDGFPCPFNSKDCECDDTISSSAPTAPKAGFYDSALSEVPPFRYATCKSSEFPSFDIPIGPRYTLESLEIVSGTAYNISAFHFAAFESIGSLAIQQTGSAQAMQKWDPLAFETTNIESFKVSYLAGMIPPPRALQRLGARNLKELFIEGMNETVHLSNASFEYFNNLSTLSISSVTFEKIDDSAFDGLEYTLGKLTISFTSLEYIPPAIYKLWQLTHLILANNNISRIPQPYFTNFTNMWSLDLQNNRLKDAIEGGLLDNLPKKLWGIDLSGNGLTEIPKRIIRNLAAITLKQNLIQSIKKDDLLNGYQLLFLSLSNNPITSIEEGAFENLNWLISVDMESVELTSMDISLVYKKSYNPFDLNLNNNPQLKFITVSSLDKALNVVQIRVQSTGLEFIDSSFKGLLEMNRQVYLSLMNNQKLHCKTMTWMAPFVFCSPKQIWIDNAICADLDNQPLEDYLKSIVPNPCTTSTTTGNPWTDTSTLATYSMPNHRHLQLTRIRCPIQR